MTRRTDPSPATVRKVRDRDHGTCIMCWQDEGLHTHHRRPRGMGGSTWPGINLPSNLITLCPKHHAWVESHREWAIKWGFLVSQHEDPSKVRIKLPRHGWATLTTDGTYQFEWETS